MQQQSKQYFWFMKAIYSEREQLRYTIELKRLKNKFSILCHKSLSLINSTNESCRRNLGADFGGLFC